MLIHSGVDCRGQGRGFFFVRNYVYGRKGNEPRATRGLSKKIIIYNNNNF